MVGTKSQSYFKYHSFHIINSRKDAPDSRKYAPNSRKYAPNSRKHAAIGGSLSDSRAYAI